MVASILLPLLAAAVAAAEPYPKVIKPVTPPPTLAIPPAPQPPTAVVIHNPEWAVRPSGEDFARYFPEAALQAGQGGHVTLSCVVTVEGRLSPCQVAEETPPGFGFGEAALRMAPLWLMRPRTVNGVAEASTARIPLTFAKPPNEPEQLTFDRATSCYGVFKTFPDVVTAFEAAAHKTGAAERGLTPVEVNAILADAASNWGAAPEDRVVEQRVRCVDWVKADVAANPPRRPQPVVITPPQWAMRPKRETAIRHYPVAARRAGLSGKVMLSCMVTVEGRAADCAVISESPAGNGFGVAAIELSKTFSLRPQTANGLPQPARARIPVVFDPSSSAQYLDFGEIKAE